MIKLIAAMDNKRGIANEHGIPWQGKVPTDVANFREKTLHGRLLMGFGWYKEQQKPLPDRQNIVACSNELELRPGFEQTKDARAYIKPFKGKEAPDVWVGGGALLFATTLDLADELYLTELEQDFDCTKFFPEYKDSFEAVDKSEPITENGVTFRFCHYRRK